MAKYLRNVTGFYYTTSKERQDDKGTINDFKLLWDDMLKKIAPAHVIVYGKLPPDCGGVETSQIPSFSEQRFKNMGSDQ